MDFLIIYSIGFAGMVAHWAKRWNKGETITTLGKYIITNIPATIKAVLGMFVGVSLALYGGADYHIPIGASLIFMGGYGSDSFFNKDTEDTRTIPEKVEAINTEGAKIDTLNVTDKS